MKAANENAEEMAGSYRLSGMAESSAAKIKKKAMKININNGIMKSIMAIMASIMA